MIITTAHCECSPVTHQITVHGKTQRDCDEAMRKDGWKKQEGVWRCGACALQWDSQRVDIRGGVCHINAYDYIDPPAIRISTPCDCNMGAYPGELPRGLLTPDEAREIAGHLDRLADRLDERSK